MDKMTNVKEVDRGDPQRTITRLCFILPALTQLVFRQATAFSEKPQINSAKNLLSTNLHLADEYRRTF